MATGSLRATLGYCKDAVRGHFNRTDFPTSMLDMALDQGRREIEEEANFWWMRGIKTLDLGDGTHNRFSLTDPAVFNIPNFKDARFMGIKRSGDKEWQICQIGTTPIEEATIHFSTVDKGIPEVVYVDNDDLVFFPPVFDQVDYQAIFFYYQWTPNPSDNLGTDDLISRFPKVLIYAALMWGYEMQLKDFQSAQYWRQLLIGDPSNRKRGELQKIKAVNFMREQQDQIQFAAMQGPWQRMRRLRLNQNIWLGAGIGW
jgi:hypothetical protein